VSADERDSSSSVKRHFTEDRLVSVMCQRGEKVTLNLQEIDRETLQVIQYQSLYLHTQLTHLMTDCSLMKLQFKHKILDLCYKYINHIKRNILKLIFDQLCIISSVFYTVIMF